MPNDYIVHKAIDLLNLSYKVRAAVDKRDYVMTPKYDGCHVVFCFDGGELVNVHSRTGETVRSMQHIADALPYHYDLSAGLLAICGEAWDAHAPFSEISGWFRRHEPQPQLGFVPFDVVPWAYNDASTSGPVVYLGEGGTSLPYRERMRFLINRHDVPSKVLRPYVLQNITNEPTLVVADKLARYYKSIGGYDGIILADADGRYNVGAGRGGEFIKVKPLLSVSLKVTGIAPAIGPKTGKNTLALIVDYSGLKQKVSTGLTQKEVDSFIRDPSLIVGQTVEVEAMAITTAGLLREPRYKGIRTDA